jgi:hypothetical protein
MHIPSRSATADSVDRRKFLRQAGGGAAALTVAGSLPGLAFGRDAASAATSETIVKHLYDSLTPGQKEAVCFGWDYDDGDRGLLRTHVNNNWNITDSIVNSDFYTDDQRKMIRDIFEGIIHPDWHAKIDQQLDDDAGGFGEEQSLAIFGKPGSDQFEFVMTGRHMTLRCDGNSADHVAFGGPIFYGHAADGFNEGPAHKGNVFWEQALAANGVYQMLDGKQRRLAEAPHTPREGRAGFRGKAGEFDGIPIQELSSDQKEEVQKVLTKLIEPYRQPDRDEVLSCLKSQGGGWMAVTLHSTLMLTSVTTGCGTTGGWKVRRLSGISAVRRMFTCGSMLPILQRSDSTHPVPEHLLVSGSRLNRTSHKDRRKWDGLRSDLCL